MDDSRLKAMLMAVEYRSISKAAEKLGYSQSGITHMMYKLENDLECPLLDRNNRGIKLTEQGERLLPYIKNVIKACDELKAEAEREGRKASKTINIGCHSSISHAWLPQIISGFKKLYPDTNINVIIDGLNLWQRLADGEIQMAFVDHRTKPEFDFIPLKEVSLVAVVPPDFKCEEDKPVSLKQLLKKPIISGNEQYVEDLLPRGVKRINVESSDDTSIIQMVESGLGVAVITELSVVSYRGNVKVLPFKEAKGYTVGIAVKSIKKTEQTVKKFIKYMQEDVKL